LCFINTHFDPLRVDDSFYEKLYYGHQISDQDPQNSSRKRIKTSEDDTSIDDITTLDNPKRRRHNSDSLIEISDSNKEFLTRYKRKFEYDDRQTYELYQGICASSSSITTKLDSCTNSSDQQENVSSLFTYHSLAYDQISTRCICVSSILRNLSFILGNDIELVKCKTLIGLLARLLLLRHGINHNHMSDNQSSSLDETVNQDQSKVKEKKKFF
jgi:hypothetical protein